MAQPLGSPYSYFTDINGAPLAGGKIYTYSAGTLTPKASYTDSTGTVSAANPVVLDSAGKATIWLDGYYKIIVKDSSDVTLYTTDNITSANSTATIPWAIATGTADAIAVTYNPVVTTLIDGFQLSFRATAANTSTTPTFSPNGLTARTITKQGGSALAAGDIKQNGEYIVFYNLTNTRWELLNPANSGAVISTQTVSGVSAVTFTNISSSYRRIYVKGSNAIPSVSNFPTRMRCSTNNGVSYDSGANYYVATPFVTSNSVVNSNGGGRSQTSIALSATASGPATGGSQNESFLVTLDNPGSSVYKNIFTQGTYYDGTDQYNAYGSAVYLSTSAVNALQIFNFGGNISGTFQLYGEV